MKVFFRGHKDRGADEGGGGSAGDGNLKPDPKPGEGAGDKGGGPKLPETQEAWLEHDKATVTAHETATAAWKTTEESFKKKLGVQGNELGTLRKLKEEIEADPEAFMEKLATSKKLKVTFGDTTLMSPAEIYAKVASGDLKPEDAAKQFEAHTDAKIATAVRGSMTTESKGRVETYLRTRYKDYDDLEAEREALSAQVAAMQMTPMEVIHLAVQGQNLPEALKAAEERGAEKALDEVLEKVKAGQSLQGSEGTAQQKSSEKKPEQTATSVIAAMNQGATR